MSKVCAACGKTLSPKEIRLNELGLKSRAHRSTYKRRGYLCSQCRKVEYEQYVKAVKDLVDKS